MSQNSVNDNLVLRLGRITLRLRVEATGEPEPELPPWEEARELLCPAGDAPESLRDLIYRTTLSLGPNIPEEAIFNNEVCRRLARGLQGDLALDRVLVAWNNGHGDREVCEGRRSHQAPRGPGMRSVYVILKGVGAAPCIVGHQAQYFELVRNRDHGFPTGVVSRGFHSLTEAAAYCTGAGCLWHPLR